MKEKIRGWFKQQLGKNVLARSKYIHNRFTATGLTFTILGYSLQKHGNQPELASEGARLDLSEPKSVLLEFTNIGKRPARRVSAALFGVDKEKD